METIYHTACGRKADTCRLFYVQSHIKGYFPDLKASAPGKLQQDGCDSPDIHTFYDCDSASREPPLFSLFIRIA